MLNLTEKHGILNGEASVLKPVTSIQKDGVDYINIFRDSDSELGRRLAPGYVMKFTTFLGITLTMKSFMSAISIKGYPLELLNIASSKAHAKKLNELKKLEKVNVPNYWALVAYALCEKVRADKKLQELMRNNKAPYTAYNVTKTSTLLGKSIVTSLPNNSMGKYVAICTYITKMLQDNKFEDKDIQEFIEQCKEAPDKDILDGVACPVHVAE